MDTEIVGSVVWFSDSFFNPISTVPASTVTAGNLQDSDVLSLVLGIVNDLGCKKQCGLQSTSIQWYGQACLCATNDNLTAAGCRPYMFLCGNFRPSFACSQPVSCPIISQTGTDSECIWSKYTTFEVEVEQLTNEYVQ